MPSVLIADPYKSSIVMTSEVFKDKIPGTVIDVVLTGADCLSHAANKKYDMIVVDFDLPDADGVSLAKALRENYTGPILITAFPEKIVAEAITKELFAYKDSAAWVKKPIQFDDLSEKIEMFLVEKQRIEKRFATDIKVMLAGKSGGRGKRPSKVKGNVLNISLGGALLKHEGLFGVKIGEEITVTLDLTKVFSNKSSVKKSKEKTVQSEQVTDSKDSKQVLGSMKLKGKVIWTNKPKKQAGISFSKLAENSKETLEKVMRQSSEV